MNKFIVFLCTVSFVYISCQEKDVFSTLRGTTMGTSYSLKYLGEIKSIQKDLYRIFGKIDSQINHYLDESTLSLYNNSKDTLSTIYEFDNSADLFIEMLERSKDIWKKSDGYFDPSMLPLISYWGFGPKRINRNTKKDSIFISSLLDSLGFDLLQYESISDTSLHIRKPNSVYALDFSAIAKGYGVDLVAEYLDEQNVENYMVEVGGEVRTKGLNENGSAWTLGINTPDENAKLNDFISYVGLSGKSLASSGDYRNFYELDGKKYSHIINPKTGYPDSQLLGASVIADDCATADAWATAFMVMGVEKALDKIEELEDISAIFIHSDENGDYIVTNYKMDGYLKK